MLSYNDVKKWLTTGLEDLGYGTDGHPAFPLIDPGPATLAKVAKKSPNSIVVVTVGNGIGPAKEGLYDQPFVVVRVYGPQNDYDTTETLAYDLDRLFMAVGETQPENVGSTRVLFMTRNATPQMIDLGADDRYVFQTTYITEGKR